MQYPYPYPTYQPYQYQQYPVYQQQFIPNNGLNADQEVPTQGEPQESNQAVPEEVENDKPSE